LLPFPHVILLFHSINLFSTFLVLLFSPIPLYKPPLLFLCPPIALLLHSIYLARGISYPTLCHLLLNSMNLI
jgi:hypothetical protein